jgi:hypothetical protein
MRSTFLTLLIFAFFSPIYCVKNIYAADVQVSGLVDFNFGTWSGGNVTLEGDVCVYKSADGTDYRVTATGSGSGGAYQVTSGSDDVSYGVAWAKKNNAFTALSNGVASNFDGANQLDTNCSGVMTATLRIQFPETNLQAAVPGNYSGNLTILIEP